MCQRTQRELSRGARHRGGRGPEFEAPPSRASPMATRRSAAYPRQTLHTRLHLRLHTRLHKRASAQVIPGQRPAVGPIRPRPPTTSRGRENSRNPAGPT